MSPPQSHSVQADEPISGRVAAAFGRVVSGRPIIRHLLPAGLLGGALWWAPWPFGSVVPWAAGVVAALGALSLAVALTAGVPLGARARSLRPVAVPAVALVLLAGLGALQAVAWPAPIAAALSPEHVRLARAAESALATGVPGLTRSEPAPAAVALSLAPAVSLRTALLVASLAAALAAAALAGRGRAGRRLLGGAVLSVALAQVLYGAPRWLARSPTLWGVAIPGSERLRGTYVNPNHFALLLEIALAVAFAWSWWALHRARREPSAERRIALVAPPALAWMTLFVALAFSGSRAGLLAAVGGLVIQAAALVATGVRRSRRGASDRSAEARAAALRRRMVRVLVGGGALLAVLAVGVGAVLMTGGEAGFSRFTVNASYDLASDIRTAVYRATWHLWGRFPWTGTGLGTFLEAYPLADGPDLGLTWWHAHSDPLELLATTGVAGGMLLLVGAGALGLRLVRRLLRVRHSEERAALVAGLGAFAAVGLHELVDFGLTMPANALALVVVLGAAAAAREPRRRIYSEPAGGADPTSST